MAAIDGFDWGASGRHDYYSFEAVDPFTLDAVEDLGAIPSECSVTYGAYTDNYSQATIVLADDEYRLHGHDRMVRIRHTVELPGGFTYDEVLGTFFVDSAERKSLYGRVRNVLTCYSALWRLTQDSLAGEYVRKKGQTVLGGVEALITYPGGRMSASPQIDASRKHTQDVRFKPGENRAETIRTICGWCDWRLGVNDLGEVTVSPYVAASWKGASYEFDAGGNCIYLPGFDVTKTGDICNRVVATWSREKLPKESDGTYAYGLSQTAVVDVDPSNEFSFDRCGRWMTYVMDVGEPCSAEDLRKRAKEYLDEHDAATRYIEVEHAEVPGLRAGDVVVYENTTDDDIRALCEVTQVEVGKLAPFCMCRSKLKVLEVAV